MKRGLATGTALIGLIVLGGCAPAPHPSADPTPSHTPVPVAACVLPYTPGPPPRTVSPPSTVSPPRTVPPSDVVPSDVVPSDAVPSDAEPSVGPASRPPTEQELAEQFERNRAANKAFRNRRALSEGGYAANRPCADRVRAGLEQLRVQQRYDPDSIKRVLVEAQLTDVVARPPGRLDAGGDGILFSGWTGRACVFGEHSPTATTVDVGGPIADGGCLPAPD